MIVWLVRKRIFRNANHAIWFLCSSGFLLLLIGFQADINRRVLAAAVALIAHLPPFITSVVTIAKKQPSEIYSKDCIWFNGFMLALYAALIAIA